MWESFGELAPPHEDLRRALVALWVGSVVGAASFLTYDAAVPGADLPASLVAVLALALAGATVAVLWGD